jgi:Dolichyl-phosphate-mannose-protein mannosyltransferase
MPSARRVPPAVLAVALVLAVRALGVAVLAAAATATGRSAHARLVRWDAQWYAGIARSGYGHTVHHPDGRLLADYAFFPLLPVLERAVSSVTGLAVVDAGLVVTWLATAAAAWGIFAVGERVAGRRAGLLLVGLWAALPVAVVTSMAYSEALFTALAAWALHAVLTRRWVLAGLLAAAAGLTRPVGVAVVVAVAVPAVLEVARRRRSRPLAALVLAPMGTLGYLAWVGVRTGDPLGYFRVADGWGNGFDGGAAFARWTAGRLTGPTWPLGALLVLGVLALLALLVLALRDRQPLPLLLLAGTLVVLALTTAGYFGSKPRYLLPAFPLLLPVAVRLSRGRPRSVALLLGALVAGSAAYGATWLLGPGPP